MPKRQEAARPGNSQRTSQKSAPAKPKRNATTSERGRRRGSSGSEPQGRVTKAAKILALLKQPGGATLKAILDATGWQAHSVRGFIIGHLVKKMALEVESFRRDGERVYAIRSKGSR
jgi:hypothetical protein